MNWMKRIGHRLATVAELLGYLVGRRPMLVPVMIGLLLLSGLVALAQATQIAPFIYTLF